MVTNEEFPDKKTQETAQQQIAQNKLKKVEATGESHIKNTILLTTLMETVEQALPELNNNISAALPLKNILPKDSSIVQQPTLDSSAEQPAVGDSSSTQGSDRPNKQ